MDQSRKSFRLIRTDLKRAPEPHHRVDQVGELLHPLPKIDLLDLMENMPNNNLIQLHFDLSLIQQSLFSGEQYILDVIQEQTCGYQVTFL